MSASNKKKLRKEQYTEKMTQRQMEQKAEAKKLKAYSISFICIMVAIVIFLVATVVVKGYQQSGVTEKNTIAATIGDYELNSVELSYYYYDAINTFYSEIAGTTYADMYFESLGLDFTVPLDQQTNPETEDTWANYFIDAALDTAKSDFAMYNEAMKAGFELSEEQRATFDSQMQVLETNAQLYGGVETYLYQIYGIRGATMENYSKYMERKEIATAYYNHYYEGLTYTAEDLSAQEEGKELNYNSYSYAYAYLSYKDFLEGGTENESGTKEYTAEEESAARAKMAEVAQTLSAATTVEELTDLVAAVEVKEGSALSVNTETENLYTNISALNADLAKWLSDEARTEGELGLVEVTAVVEDDTTADDATEETEAETEETKAETEENKTEAETEETAEKTTVVNGIYVLIYQGATDNRKPMDNVRHILVAPEGGHTDEETGETVYTEAEWTQAELDAEKLLKQWQDGDATEESFIAMVAENTDDTASAETGGLYENINPASQYVPEFLSWAIDANRKEGDVEIVKTEHGYHIMYYVGTTETTYRDYMLTEELRNNDIVTYVEEAEEATVVTKKDLSKLNTSRTLTM